MRAHTHALSLGEDVETPALEGHLRNLASPDHTFFPPIGDSKWKLILSVNTTTMLPGARCQEAAYDD